MLNKYIFLIFISLIFSFRILAQNDTFLLIAKKIELETIRLQNEESKIKINDNINLINKLSKEGNDNQEKTKTIKLKIDSLVNLINPSLLNGYIDLDNEDSIKIIKDGIQREIDDITEKKEKIKKEYKIKLTKQNDILKQTQLFSDSITFYTNKNNTLESKITYLKLENKKLEELDNITKKMSDSIYARTFQDYSKIINYTAFFSNKTYILYQINKYLNSKESDLQSKETQLKENYKTIISLKELIYSLDSVNQFMTSRFDTAIFKRYKTGLITLQNKEGFQKFHQDTITSYISYLENYCNQMNRLAKSVQNNTKLLTFFDHLQSTPNEEYLKLLFKEQLGTFIKDHDLMSIPYIKTLLTNAYADHRKLTKTEMEFLKNYKTDFNCNNKN
jgi:hypothetical protein